MKRFESFLAKELMEYAAYRQGLGYTGKAIRPHLLAFDRYLTVQNADWNHLNPQFFLQLRANICKSPSTTNTLISSLRGFFDFLVRQEIYTENPLKDIPPVQEKYFLPFIFSPEQTDQLLKAVCHSIRKNEKYYLFDSAVYLAIVLLAHCGMRINEPLRLKKSDYRADEGTVYIERTKFRKDRLIPVPKMALAQIENYLAARKALWSFDNNPYFLAGKEQKPLKDYHIRLVFHQAVKEIGLKGSKKNMANVTFGYPIPHSLRHGFAVNTLNRIRARGMSPQQALPVLAAYMGHRRYQYTGAYLKVKNAQDVTGLKEFAKARLFAI